jgi:hypothetical protein
MKFFLVTINFIFLSLLSEPAFAQQPTTMPDKWLAKQLKERKNLHVFNKNGFEQLAKVFEIFASSGLVLGYYLNDSLFIYNQSVDVKKNGCMTVQIKFLADFDPNKKVPSTYVPVKLFDESTIWNYTPLAKNKPTLIAFFNKKSSKRQRRFYKVDSDLQKNNFDVKLIFIDYSLEK